MPKRLIAPTILLALTTSATFSFSQEASAARVKLNLPSQERKTFISRLAQSNPLLRGLWRKVRGSVTVRLAGANEPMGGNYTISEISKKDRYTIVLQQSNFARGNQLGYHLQAHEMGHVIANSLFVQSDYEKLIQGWQQDPLWQDCYPQAAEASSDCVPLDEIVADQIAFWATGNSKVRSSYDLPPLNSDKSLRSISRRLNQAKR